MKNTIKQAIKQLRVPFKPLFHLPCCIQIHLFNHPRRVVCIPFPLKYNQTYQFQRIVASRISCIGNEFRAVNIKW